MKSRKLITIVLDYETTKEAHPSEWDWAVLLDKPNEDILRVEVFSVGSSTHTEEEQLDDLRQEPRSPNHPTRQG